MKALVTGIKPYTVRLTRGWADFNAPRFDVFNEIRTRRQLVDANRSNGNTGNYFIGEGAMEAIGREKATYGDFGFLHSKSKDPAYAESLAAQFDCLVFVTANMLRTDYDAKVEAELLSRIKLPVVVLGIGCQRRHELAGNLPEGTRAFLSILRERDHHVFTRGADSTAYLKTQGLQNVWPTGCPSLFLRPGNFVRALQALKSFDWKSPARMMFSGYIGEDIETVKDMQVFRNRAQGSSYVLQDEHMFSKLDLQSADDDDVYNDMSGELTCNCAFAGAEAVKDIRKLIFFNTHQWRSVAATHHVAFGRRFHGVVAALQAGVPGLMIAVDDRMREMLLEIGLPFIDIHDWRKSADKLDLIRKTVDRFDVDRFEADYLARTRLFRSRLAAIDPAAAVAKPAPAVASPAPAVAVKTEDRKDKPTPQKAAANIEAV